MKTPNRKIQWKKQRSFQLFVFYLLSLLIIQSSASYSLNNGLGLTPSQLTNPNDPSSTIINSFNIDRLQPQDVIQPILLLHADPDGAIKVANRLNNYGIPSVNIFMNNYVPSLQTLLDFQVVMVWDFYAPSYPVPIGNLLADYLDAGGRVITCSSTFGIQGRFFSDYYSPFLKTIPANAQRTYNGGATHSLFDSVTFVQGRYPSEPVQLDTSATLIASYTDGIPFVAIKEQVVGLNAYPNPDYWDGDFDLLWINAINFLLKPRVLLLYSSSITEANAISNLIDPNGYRVEVLSVTTSTPALSVLEKYPVVISWDTSYEPDNTTTLGNLLADYIDSGGTFIMMPYLYYQEPWSLGGRFQTELYSPFTYVTNSNLGKAYSGGSLHYIFGGVNNYTSTHVMLPDLTPGAFPIAYYDDGTLFAALKGSVLAINSFIPYSTGDDIYLVLVNAVDYFVRGIHLDYDAPALTDNVDFTIIQGTDRTISWIASDSNPYWYEISVNGIPIDSGSWQSDSTLSMDLSGFTFGDYIFDISVYDMNGNVAYDTAKVTVVKSTAPIIIGQNNIEYEQGTTSHVITWTLFHILPDSYQVYRDNGLIQQDSWINNTSLEISVDGLVFGLHNYTIVAYAQDGNKTSNTVLVNVIDTTPPLILGSEDFTTIQYSNTTMSWQVSDYNPSTYEVTRNGTVVNSGDWISLSNVTIIIDVSEVGYYIYQIKAYDEVGNSATHIVGLTVIPANIPLISSPQDIYMVEGDINYRIIWYVSDNDPLFYVVELNNQTIKNESLVAVSMIEIFLSSYSSGYYNFTVTLFDSSNNQVSDTVMVQIYHRAQTTPTSGRQSGGFVINPSTNSLIIGSAAIVLFMMYGVVRRRR